MGLTKLIDLDLLSRFLEKVRVLIPSTYASSKSAGGYADKALSVPIATVDSTSTSTAFTVQVTEFANETGPRDGLFFYIYNNKVASASGWTLNVNGWGAKPVYNTSAERITTEFALNRIFPCWYDSTLATDGCWVIGFLTDANTTYITFRNIDHGNGAGRIAHSAVYRYQMLFEKDSDYVTPLNNVSNGYNNTNKAMLTNVEFDPFGEIFYWYSSVTVAKDARASGNDLNYTYGTLDLRYTFNCGTTLTAYKPFYLVVDIGTNGKAKIASTTPWAQELPSTNDGHYYIFLGRTCSAYQLSLYPWHPVYYHDGTTIRQYLPVDAKSVNGHTVGTNVPANAVFTDTTYESKAAASGGTAVSLVTTGEKYTWNNKGTYSKPSGGIPDSDIASAATWNAKGNGTITGITMNGASKGTSGVVDLGTVITVHQDISGKADKSATVSNVAYDSTNKKLTKTINGTTSDVVTAVTLKTAMALNNVENKSSATIRGELTKANVTTALGYIPPTTDTTYESKTAASGGTDVSLVTTGEKYTWNSKQAALVSGTNIKTINGSSLLGSGDLAVSGLPAVTSSDNDKVLKVVNGVWVAAENDGGSMPVNAAVIHVNAPLGSAITFFKGSTVMEAVTAAQTHPNADGKTEDYYYSVPTSDFGSWTVAASKSGENDATQSFSILFAKQYDAFLSYLAPYDFQAVEWLQTSTSAYFDTGIIPTTTNYTTKVSLQVAVADGENIFNVEGGYGMDKVTSYEQLRYNYAGGQVKLNVPGIATVGTDFDIIYNNDSGVVMINGVEVSAHPNIKALDNRQYSILVSAARYGASVSYYGTWRYKRFTVLERDTKNVLIDMHPCYRKMDNMPGFWDSVSNTFITQLGTGIITVGPDL